MTEDAIRDLLIEIKTKVDLLVTWHGDHETRIRGLEQRPIPNPTMQNDHETRIRDVEASIPPEHQKQHDRLNRVVWIAVGASVAAGGLAGKIAGFLG